MIQNDAGNTAASVTLSLPTQINNFNFGAANRGDFNIHVGPTVRNVFSKGVMIPSVSQNGRNNATAPNVGGTSSVSVDANGKAYPTVATEYTAASIFVPVSAAGDGDEYNVNFSTLYFPYSVDGKQGFIGGFANNLTNGTGNGTAVQTADSSFSPGINLGTQFIQPVTPNGTYTLNLTGVTGAPANASQNGVLLVVAVKNEDNYALSQANPDGTFTLYSHDNGVNGTAYEQDGVAFAYIPAGTTGLTAGRVLGTTAPTQVTTATSGSYSVAAVSTGMVRLTIPGVTGPNDGVLVVTPEGGGAANNDNIVNYEWDSVNGGFLVQTRDISNATAVPALQNLGATEPMFSFAYMPLPRVDQTNSASNFGRFLGARVEAAETLVGLNSSTSTLTSGTGGAGLLQTTASLLAGSNTSAAAKMVEISWRTRTTEEASGTNHPILISDVARVTGLDGEAFTLQMNYNQALLDSLGVNEASIAASGELHLAWFDGTTWVNAIDGNSTVGSSAKFHQQLSWTDFVTANPGVATNLSNYLGSWGVDPANNQVWAVLNHNSDFAVIPEPSTVAFAGAGLAALVWRRMRRTGKASTAN